jgi:hypothetical protein
VAKIAQKTRRKGDKPPPLPYTSAKSAHRAFSGKVAFPVCRVKMLDFLNGAYSFRKTVSIFAEYALQDQRTPAQPAL